MRIILGAAALVLAAACNPPATEDTTQQDTAIETPAPVQPAITVTTEQDARARIEGAGYTNVTGLTQNADGTWTATATQGGQTASVTVDAQGNVTMAPPAPTP